MGTVIATVADGIALVMHELPVAYDQAFRGRPLAYRDADGSVGLHAAGIRREPGRLYDDLERVLLDLGAVTSDLRALVDLIVHRVEVGA